jgi:predicted PurR-regulated permease PerM
VTNGNRANTNGGSATLLTVVIVVAVLYFARVVLIPLALAVLFSFLFTPIVVRLRHWGLGRVSSSVIVVLCSFLVMSIIGTAMTSQLTDTARKMPEYQENIRKKLQSIRSSGGGWITRVTRVVSNFTDELIPPPPAPVKNQTGEEKPVPVEIRKAPFAPFELMQKILGSVLNIVLMMGVVVVLVIFMLIQREDLRDRLIRLIGAGKVNVATQALDDASERVSRYLLAQLIVNIAYGMLAGLGLYFLRVPDPLLWGIVAALLRYIPYLGIWIAALMPAAMAFAVEPGWIKVPAIFGLYFGIDLLIYNLVEPFLYGTSTGVSPFAILLAAVFWTWLWGPVGLLLATPLTVCLVVIGRYVPSLEFLSVMLSDEPVLKAETRFYQRLLAMDLEEATHVAEEFLKGKSLEALDDEVIVPALTLAERDRHRGKLDEAHEQFLFQNTRLLAEDMAERAEDVIEGNTSPRTCNGNKEPVPRTNGSDGSEPEVLCIPARDEADEIAALMLAQLLNKKGVTARALSAHALASECLQEVDQGQTRLACIVAVPPLGYTHARYLCRRLRSQFPALKLVAAILTERDVEEIKNRKPAIPADELVTSLKQAVTAICSLAHTSTKHSEEAVLAAIPE